MTLNLIALDNYSRGIDDLYHTNSVILPPRVLEENSTCLDLFIFRLTAQNGLSTYVGVREFSAPDDHIIVPWWILDYLGIGPNNVITLEKAEGILPGKRVVLEPKDKEFFDIPECEGCLEQKLSNFTVLQEGETICLNILDKNYHILIKEVEPDWSKMKEEEEPKPKKKKRGRKKKKPIKVETEVEEEKIDIIINDKVINIKNIDLTVEISNPFFEEMNQEKEMLQDNKSNFKINSPKKSEPGMKLGGNILKSREEMRLARLKRFDKSKTNNIEI
jgi:hypothetical protein